MKWNMHLSLCYSAISLVLASPTVHADIIWQINTGPQSFTEHDIYTQSYQVYSLDDAASLTLNNVVIDDLEGDVANAVVVSGKTDTTFVANNTVLTGTTNVKGQGNVTVDLSGSQLVGVDTVPALDISDNGTTGSTRVTIADNTQITGDVDVTTKSDTTLSNNDSILNGALCLNDDGNSTDSTTVNITNASIMTDSTAAAINIQGTGTTDVTITGTTISQTNTELVRDSVDVFSDASASLNIGDSSLQYGAYDRAINGDATVRITNSSIGENADEDATYNNNYMVTAQIDPAAVKGEYTASADIENSIINGNVAVQAQNGGTSIVTLSQGTKVSGYVYAIGSNNTINISSATLNGNIYTGEYNDSDSDIVNSTINLTDTTYRGEIKSENGDVVTDNLTININDGAEIGGRSEDAAQKIVGYDSVNVNLNYLNSDDINRVTAAPADITTLDHTAYFYISNNEAVQVDDGVTNQGTLAPVRSGSYILDDVTYATQQTRSDADGSTYAVAFYTENSDPVPSDDVVSDILAAQAGLVASDDMIHRIADDIIGHLDTRTPGSNLWVSGIYAGSDRDAGQTQYSNDISGAQIGGYLNTGMVNGDTLTVGIANGYLHNALDLRNREGHNTIDGTYYSLYGRWEQPATRLYRWFADTVLTYGDMSYSASGTDADIHAGGDYDGRTWLAQGRAGITTQAGRFDVQPYATLGYINVQTDGYNDGYSDIGEGKQTNGFVGGGVRVATYFSAKHIRNIQPYLTVGYNTQFGGSTELKTNDYSFSGENLDGGDAGVGVTMKFNAHWMVDARIETAFGHAIDNAVEGNMLLSYRF
jgi:outer membrane autotransporter protein